MLVHHFYRVVLGWGSGRVLGGKSIRGKERRETGRGEGFWGRHVARKVWAKHKNDNPARQGALRLGVGGIPMEPLMTAFQSGAGTGPELGAGVSYAFLLPCRREWEQIEGPWICSWVPTEKICRTS